MFPSPFAAAAEPSIEAGPGIASKVRLTTEAGGGPGLSIAVDLTPAEPGTRRLPALRELRLQGDLGSLDVEGIPTCRPSPRSIRNPGCAAPSIGAGHGFAYEDFGPEGSGPLKVYGRFRLYSGGQHGTVARLYAWASFPDAGPHEEGRAFVVPITSTREGAGRSDLRLSLPHPEIVPVFSVAEIKMSIKRQIRVGRRLIEPVHDGRCRPRRAGSVRIEADFYGPRPPEPVATEVSPSCHG